MKFHDERPVSRQRDTASLSERVARRLRLGRRLARWRDRASQRALIHRGWYDPSARIDEPAIFIGGCGRSGTTLLRQMLNRHPRLFCGPETSMFGLPFQLSNIESYWSVSSDELQRDMDQAKNLVEFATNFLHNFAEREGKALWIDKTPNNVRAISEILTWFPQGRFIHMVRDGRDVVCSLRHHPREKIVNGTVVPTRVNHPISQCASRWFNDTLRGLAFKEHPRCLEVRYEHLVADPEGQMRRVCEFIGEEFDPGILSTETDSKTDLTAATLVNNSNAADPVSHSSIGRWRRDLTASERQDFIDVAGELLIAMGYVANHEWALEF